MTPLPAPLEPFKFACSDIHRWLLSRFVLESSTSGIPKSLWPLKAQLLPWTLDFYRNLWLPPPLEAR